MKYYNSLENIPQFKNPVITIGSFDGVHLGHQRILSVLKNEAEKINGETVVLSFYPHPRQVLNPANSIKLLSTLEEKKVLFEKMGIDHFVVVPFTNTFKEMTPLDYISDFLVKFFRPKTIVIGYDHRFGKDRGGEINFLKSVADQFNFEVIEIAAKEIDEITVSSTKVRNALESGKLNKANHLLGYPYLITGEVVEGDKIGRNIGYPTCNIEPKEKEKLIPHDGVYAVRIEIDKKSHQGMLYIGKRPTLNLGTQRRIEVNIFDFDENVYGKEVVISLMEFIRHDMAFTNIEDLILQLDNDKIETLRFFNP